MVPRDPPFLPAALGAHRASGGLGYRPPRTRRRHRGDLSIEDGWTLLDAFYMTMLTITTVWYREVHPLGPAGQIFTSFLAVGGLGVLFYTLARVAQAVFEGELANVLADSALGDGTPGPLRRDHRGRQASGMILNPEPDTTITPSDVLLVPDEDMDIAQLQADAG